MSFDIFDILIKFVNDNTVALLSLMVSIASLCVSIMVAKNKINFEKEKIVYQELKEAIKEFNSCYESIDSMCKNEYFFKNATLQDMLIGFPKIFLNKYKHNLKATPNILKNLENLVSNKIKILEKFKNNFKPTKEIRQSNGLIVPDPNEWASSDTAQRLSREILTILSGINNEFNKIIPKIKK